MASYPSDSAYPLPPSLQHDQNLVAGENDAKFNALPGQHNLVQPYPYETLHSDQGVSYDTANTSNGNGLVPQQLINKSGSNAGAEIRGNRLKKACDSCSARKVKCDESGPPCLACAALDIPCTFNRPSRRRGPPNRHAEAIKRQKTDLSGAHTIAVDFSSPSSPNNVAATLASFSSHAVLSAESICPFPTLELFVDDFFTYIHPLVPFPHEPSFRAAFRQREDLNNPSFLALLASMIGALVATHPQRPKTHLHASQLEHAFPNSLSLVERCHKIAVEARGPGYLDKDLSVYDAATSYFLGLAAANVSNWQQCRLYLGETLTIARVAGINRHHEQDLYTAGSLQDGFSMDEQTVDSVDFIRQEIGRRIFWVVVMTVRSMQQRGASSSELTIPPPTRRDPYPPLPIEVDDQFIYVDHIESQPQGALSALTGFNLNVQFYMTYVPLTTMELAYGIGEIFDLTRQKRILEDCLKAVKRSLDSIPNELVLGPRSQAGQTEQNLPLHEDSQYLQSHYNHDGTQEGTENTDSKDNRLPRRFLQYEIQKFDLLGNQLAIRTYLIEKYWNLTDTHNAQILEADNANQLDQNIQVLESTQDKLAEKKSEDLAASQQDSVNEFVSAQQENLVGDLLIIFGALDQYSIDRSGGSFLNKLRLVTSALLETSRIRKGPLALRAADHLDRFLNVFTKLEKLSPSHGHARSYIGVEDDVSEKDLTLWVELRDCQNVLRNGAG